MAILLSRSATRLSRRDVVERERIVMVEPRRTGMSMWFARDSPLEGDGFELPVPRVLEPSQFIRLLDTAFAFCRRDRRPPGNGCQNRGLYDIKVYGVKEDAALPEDSGTVFVR